MNAMRRSGVLWVVVGVSSVFVSVASTDAQVAIPDSNLKAAVKQALGITHDPNQNEMLSLTWLIADSNGISNLNGLEYATNLGFLDLRDNQINDISPLTNLSNLGVLYLGSNLISDLSPLANLTSLSDLRMPSNQISNISPLARLTSLSVLLLGDNQISDISHLANLTNLGNLSLRVNHISDISVLASLTRLDHLDLSGNPTSDCSPLENLTNLWWLGLSGNQISDISFLAKLTKLGMLGLGDNQIRDISPLADLTDLFALMLNRNQISDISPLANLTNLSELDLSDNQIRDISPLADLTGLIGLSLFNNQISDISPLANLTSMERLFLAGNQIKDLSPLTNLTSLGSLWLHGNPISDISPLARLTSLRELRMGGTQVSDIYPLANLTGLTELWLRGDPLNMAAYTTYIPQILANNPGIDLQFDPPRWQTLTISSTEGGSVLTPGEGPFQVNNGTVLTIEAVPADPNHDFKMWSGPAADSGKVQDGNSPKTTILVDGDSALQAVFVKRTQPAFGFSIGEIAMDDPQQFESRVSTNNTPGVAQIERVTGQRPDPNGMMAMHVVNGSPAQAKGRFGRTRADRVRIGFKYLFELPDLEIKVFLSDRPDLGDRDPLHVKEVAKFMPPAAGRPGSVGSGRFGQFELWASTAGLELSQGTWVELELVQKAGTQALRIYNLGAGYEASDSSAWTDDWFLRVQECTDVCMDLTWNGRVDEADFLWAMAIVGHTVGSESDELGCCEGMFSTDGYIDSLDPISWDWALKHPSRGNLCDVPLRSSTTGGATTSPVAPVSWQGVGDKDTGLMVLGKRSGTDAILKDDLFLLGGSDQGGKSLSLGTDRCNVRMTQGRDGHTYLINSETGVWRLNANGSAECIVPSGLKPWSYDPRYSTRPATISIGIQNQGSSPVSGRPILDAAIVGTTAYVVPVVVSPEKGEPYVAAAKLDLRPEQNPPYEVVRVYDDSHSVNANNLHNPNLSGLREIEVDEADRVYILNAHSQNESDMLWKYDPNGTVLCSVVLGNPHGVYLPGPIGLCVVGSGKKQVYVASGQVDPNNPNSSRVYGFSTEGEKLSLERTVIVKRMQHVTGMTAEPKTGIVWVVGYGVKNSPVSTDPSVLPASEPYLAWIPSEVNSVDANCLADRTGDLALPTSIVWIGQ